MGSGDSLGVPSSQKNSEPRVIILSTPPPQCSYPLHRIPCAKFEKMRKNERVKLE